MSKQAQVNPLGDQLNTKSTRLGPGPARSRPGEVKWSNGAICLAVDNINTHEGIHGNATVWYRNMASDDERALTKASQKVT